MTNEEILQAAQASKGETGEYERTVEKRALMYGLAFGVALCVGMVVFELLCRKPLDMGKPALLIAISGFISLYEGVKMNHKKMIMSGAVELLIAVLALVWYIGAVLK